MTTTINKINRDQVFSFSLEQLSLNDNKNRLTIISSVIRKVASSICPCSVDTIINNSFKNIQFLLEDETLDKNEVRQCVRDLINYGDLLHLNEIEITKELTFPKNHLHLSPMKFVEIYGNRVALIGIQKETDFPRGTVFEGYVEQEGILNYIDISKMNNCIKTLKEFNFRQVSEDDWLNLPSEKNLDNFLTNSISLLSKSQNYSKLEELEILSKQSKFFKERFAKLFDQTGFFVTRQKNVGGSFTWSLSEINKGNVNKHIDLPLSLENSSGFDQAMRILISLDEKSGFKHLCYQQNINEESFYNFNTPLPKWVERKFMFNGAIKVKNPKKFFLISYKLNKNNNKNVDLKNFLFQYLNMEMSIIDGNP